MLQDQISSQGSIGAAFSFSQSGVFVGHVDKPVLLVLKQKESKKNVQIYCQKSVSVQLPEEADWQLCLERGAVYGARTASGLVIFRWIEINFNFKKSKLHQNLKKCERLGVEEVAGS